MRFVLFVHSLVSDWNHGNAHFLRGVVTELQERGYDVSTYEPVDGWSAENLRRDQGPGAIAAFHRRFPQLTSTAYHLDTLDLDAMLDGADVVIVHEWNEPELIAAIGRHRVAHDYALLFHDTHHRAVTKPDAMGVLDLTNYDGVLAFGSVIRDAYLERRWIERAWTWHEGADVRVFRPLPTEPEGDLVWIGNLGDDERGAELDEYLFGPVRALELSGAIHGVRYPADPRRKIREAGLEFRGWIPNYDVPKAFARHRVTVHVPRRPYAEQMHGVPTIRVFEALACGIPLISAPWRDSDGLFRVGRDFLMAGSGAEMEVHLKEVLNDPAVAEDLSRSGLETIRARHTCAHRVDELLSIVEELR